MVLKRVVILKHETGWLEYGQYRVEIDESLYPRDRGKELRALRSFCGIACTGRCVAIFVS